MFMKARMMLRNQLVISQNACQSHTDGKRLPSAPKPTQTLGTFLREDILHIAHITGQDIPAVFDAGRETLEETIVDMSNLIIEHDRMIVETKLHTLFGRLAGEHLT